MSLNKPIERASDTLEHSTDWSKLTRERYEMPEDVLARLEERCLLEAYRERPAYQQNDYIGWINRAKRPATREKRLSQMLEELVLGNVYMNMDWHGRRG